MIRLYMNKTNYENDVRALIMAFYHGEKIVLNPDLSKALPDEEDPVLFEMHIDFTDPVLAAWIGECQEKCETVFEDYKQTKNDLKRLVYKVLCQYTGKSLPWGTLTGIRPTKISMDLLERGYTHQEMYDYFKEEYKISDDKYHLCTKVAENEREILKDVDYEQGFSLYVGIPFCPTICAYCSFSSFPLNVWKHKVEDYLDALFHEIDVVSKKLGDKAKPLTFYMGGGTPTSLNADQMDRLLTKLEEAFHIDEVRECTIEAGRPDSITRDKLEVIKKHGITRISINPQTMNQKTLDAIGRRHTVEQVKEAFALARDCGFDNINMDLIAGLQGESVEDFIYTLNEVEKLKPESLTVHSLAIKRAARVNRERLYLQSASVEEVSQMINLSFEAAQRMGLEPYYLYRQKNIAGNLENVGYAKPGLAAFYNILIMEEKQSILALGAGGSTKVVYREEGRIERVENVKSVKDYIERIDEMLERKENVLEVLK